MPKGRAVACPEGNHIPHGVAAERESGIGGQHPGARTVRTELVAPANLTRLVIDRFEHSLAPYAVVRAGPTESAILRLEEIDSVARMSIHDEQPGFLVEAGRTIVRHPAFIGRDQASIGSWLFFLIRNRPSVFIHALRPVHRPERNR